MPTFAYTARDERGKRIEGTVSADSERAALAVLDRRKLFPLKVAPQKDAGGGPLGFLLGRGVSADTRCRFYRQLADLLKAGLPILRALSTLERQTADKRFKPMLEEIRNAVSGGSDLADALSEFPEVFGELELGMIRAGEKGGFLEDVLLRLAQFTERAREVSGQIAGAMVYPALLTVAGIGVVVVMMVFVLPSFATMLEGMGQLPLPTRIVMGISDFLRQNLLILLGGIAVFGYALLSWMRTPDGSRTVDAIKLRVPVLAGVTLQIAVARFARTLGTLLGSGIQIGPAMKIAADAAGNKILAEELLAAAERVKQGETLAAPLADSRFFPPLLTEMIAVGEETGTLDRVLVDAAATYEREADRAVSLLVRMIEPVILVLMTGIVMVVALAAIMPALTAAANMGKR